MDKNFGIEIIKENAQAIDGGDLKCANECGGLCLLDNRTCEPRDEVKIPGNGLYGTYDGTEDWEYCKQGKKIINDKI